MRKIDWLTMAASVVLVLVFIGFGWAGYEWGYRDGLDDRVVVTYQPVIIPMNTDVLKDYGYIDSDDWREYPYDESGYQRGIMSIYLERNDGVK